MAFAQLADIAAIRVPSNKSHRFRTKQIRDLFHRPFGARANR